MTNPRDAVAIRASWEGKDLRNSHYSPHTEFIFPSSSSFPFPTEVPNFSSFKKLKLSNWQKSKISLPLCFSLQLPLRSSFGSGRSNSFHKNKCSRHSPPHSASLGRQRRNCGVQRTTKASIFCSEAGYLLVHTFLVPRLSLLHLLEQSFKVHVSSVSGDGTP